MRNGREIERQRHAGQESAQSGVRGRPAVVVMVVVERIDSGHGLQAGHQTGQVVRR